MTPLGRRAITLLRKSKVDDVFPIVWEFVHRITLERFANLSKLIAATDEELLPLTPDARDDIIRVIVQALESEDMTLLNPDPHFTVGENARPAGYTSPRATTKI